MSMNEQSMAKTLDKANQGHAARMVIDFLSDTLEAENASIDREAFRLIHEKALSPEMALALWQRRDAIRALVAKLHTKIEVGRRAQLVHPAGSSNGSGG